eukprot:TRINITY_DN47747_c0_g1_i1.p1 TRINITY_DN47747_c0_g1~~TRINITY_DN47747_c0_g1_i1.p1  ORF type:complete len:220 (-),score=40.01 TRINITY_DN47747_c0_g1_i1:37-696(-)
MSSATALLDVDPTHFKPGFHEHKKLFTECFFVDDSGPKRRVLLGVKKRGFKAGRIFGFGGKVDKQDGSILAAAAREVQEESGLSERAVELRKVGLVYVQFPDKNFEIHAYRAALEEVKSSPEDVEATEAASDTLPKAVETEEMRPKWFDADDVPWERALPDTKLWFPAAWHGEPFLAQFVLDKDDGVIWHSVEVVDADALARIDAHREKQFGPDCMFLS